MVALASVAWDLFHDGSLPPVGATGCKEATRGSAWDTVSQRGLGEGRTDTALFPHTHPHQPPFSLVSLQDRSFFGKVYAFRGFLFLFFVVFFFLEDWAK